MSFGEYLDATMKARGFPTAASLSRATGIRDGVLSKWLNDRNDEPPRTYMLRRLVDALDVPLIELVVAAKIMTYEEARLPAEPQPPKFLGEEDIDEMINSSSMDEDRKAALRAEFLRLRKQAFDEAHRAQPRRNRQASDMGDEDRRQGA